MKNFIITYLPLIFWCGVIFLLSSIPGLRISESVWDFILRKGAHIFMYFILFLLAYRAYPTFMIAFLFCSLYALSDEIHQSFVASRSGNALDFLIDSLGTSLGILVVRIYEKRRF